MRIGPIASLIAIVVCVPVIGMLIAYGTASPCGALRSEMHAVFLQNVASRGGDGSALGVAMATMMAGPVIDGMIASLSPWQCARALVRLKTEGPGALGSFGQAMAGAVQRKPPLDWRKELRLRGDPGYETSHGWTTFKGEVENVGPHTIRSLKLYVYFYDGAGKEISEKSNAVLYGFSEPMRPGHIKPFRVMTEAVTGTAGVKYRFEIEEYE